jgi:hypothetical protein
LIAAQWIERGFYLIAAQQMDRTRTLRRAQISTDLLLQAIIFFFDTDGTDENDKTDCNVEIHLIITICVNKSYQ